MHAEYVIKCNLFTGNGVKSKVDKSKFDWYKITKTLSVENLLKYSI